MTYLFLYDLLIYSNLVLLVNYISIEIESLNISIKKLKDGYSETQASRLCGIELNTKKLEIKNEDFELYQNILNNLYKIYDNETR
ncbi:hypothetical protein H8356DRAFT_1348366 [Neocallimastix lanati (nom. inval.)]|nr:hypothetical protein H8356DRAFT_1348366 [Neocallimastix sp. JGI-2020a]